MRALKLSMETHLHVLAELLVELLNNHRHYSACPWERFKYFCGDTPTTPMSLAGGGRVIPRTLKLSLSSAISSNSSMHFFTRFFRITFRILLCWSISREMFSGRS